MATTLALNIPPVIFGAQSAGGDGSCQSVRTWVLVNAALCAAHIVAAFYIIIKIQADKELSQGLLPSSDPEKQSQHQQPDVGYYGTSETRSKSFSRMKQVLCEDPGVAIYLIVLFFYGIWTMVGIGRTLGDGDCGSDLQSYAQNALFFNFAFIAFGGGAFCCSLCCLH
jgi:hypothetical protein